MLFKVVRTSASDDTVRPCEGTHQRADSHWYVDMATTEELAAFGRDLGQALTVTTFDVGHGGARIEICDDWRE